ncbi:hypothetical protein [Parasitella parasitica]|uniref:Uncharacterized protein n=1 Tax=Parasitella parasitica TaxID=35722 RepID=A0A0B7N3D0_9FUNG|nr:hypothetical protein [Parasitella parasitica]
MIRVQRLIYYIVILAFFAFISIVVFPYLKESNATSPANTAFNKEQGRTTTSAPKKKVSDPNQERYLSWFPHSDFPEQQESFRNALRLALETKRTIIAPMLRINKIYPWMPFEDLAKRYEAQEKTTLQKTCDAHQTNWQTALEPCESIHDWIEIPWSSIMDLDVIQREYGIRIIERTTGHGWGVHESALGGQIDPEDVAVVDVMSFKENGTDWEHVDPAEEALKQKPSRFSSWLQSHLKPKQTEKLTQPLKYVLNVDQLHAIDAKIIQFGALNSAARYQTTPSEIQQELRKALMKTRFIVPDQMARLTAQSAKIIDTLGGKFQYSTLILNLSKLVAMDARAGTIQHLAVDGLKKEDEDRVVANGPSTMEDLDLKARKELMEAVVLEIFGDIPINQAVSAAMPIKPSKLADVLRLSANQPRDRRQLLDACIDYHKNVEQRYPVYYLMNDMGVAPETRPDIFGPLLDMFPCVFSKQDMLNWGIQTDSWALGQPELNDLSVDYEKLLQPLLDILIAGKGYSFFEIPTTPLTRFLNWSPKQ